MNRDAVRASVILRGYRRAASIADGVDERHRRRSRGALGPGHPGVVAAAWGTAKLAAVGLASPILGPIVLARASKGTSDAKRLTSRYPSVIRRLIEGGVADFDTQRVKRAPARAAYFLSSDLHRCVAGTVDWAHHQGVASLYDVALDYYADRDWGLVENGDVEDFWLTGGSTYGVVYDIFRLAAGIVQRTRSVLGRAPSSTPADIATEHLRRIVANNASTYDRIDQRFHRYGRYFRLVGNHDDVFLDPAMVDALGEVHEGIGVFDFLLLVDDSDATVGVVTHGHHTDAWNSPLKAGLGRFGTWMGSALLDVPHSRNPGMPDPAETARLLEGRLADRLTRVSRRFGANRDLYSLDEVLLFEAWKREWSKTAEVGSSEPWLVLGHTHLPLIHPLDPGSAEPWTRYANSGAGIFHECITGVEWDGTDDPQNPIVRLVAWRYADRDPQTPPDAVVGWDGERAVVREVLDRIEPSDRLQVVSRGHDRRPVDA